MIVQIGELFGALFALIFEAFLAIGRSFGELRVDEHPHDGPTDSLIGNRDGGLTDALIGHRPLTENPTPPIIINQPHIEPIVAPDPSSQQGSSEDSGTTPVAELHFQLPVRAIHIAEVLIEENLILERLREHRSRIDNIVIRENDPEYQYIIEKLNDAIIVHNEIESIFDNSFSYDQEDDVRREIERALNLLDIEDVIISVLDRLAYRNFQNDHPSSRNLYSYNKPKLTDNNQSFSEYNDLQKFVYYEIPAQLVRLSDDLIQLMTDILGISSLPHRTIERYNTSLSINLNIKKFLFEKTQILKELKGKITLDENYKEDNFNYNLSDQVNDFNIESKIVTQNDTLEKKGTNVTTHSFSSDIEVDYSESSSLKNNDDNEEDLDYSILIFSVAMVGCFSAYIIYNKMPNEEIGENLPLLGTSYNEYGSIV